MRLSAVLSPFLLLLAPLILVVLASFTTLAVFTSLLALVVVGIRLGFLMIEFSGGVVLDVLGWGKQKWNLTEQFKAPTGEHIKDIKSTKHLLKKDYQYKSQQRKQNKLYQAAVKVNRWDADAISGDFNLDGNDIDADYFMLRDGINTKRPQGRRIRSYV